MEIKKSMLVSTLLINSIMAQIEVKKVDLEKYAGKWFVIASIPTRFDKNWKWATESYYLEDGKYDILTTYLKEGSKKEKKLKSKGFPIPQHNYFKWKVQFVWPFKTDYLIEELAFDYSYVVVGHPKKKFLYIMSRTPKMDEALYTKIAERFAGKGYDMSKLKKLL
jgi:apolipoprotein D and lipocalin family protein